MNHVAIIIPTEIRLAGFLRQAGVPEVSPDDDGVRFLGQCDELRDGLPITVLEVRRVQTWDKYSTD